LDRRAYGGFAAAVRLPFAPCAATNAPSLGSAARRQCIYSALIVPSNIKSPPIATYQVVDTYENVSVVRSFIHEERPNLRLDLDLDAMSADDCNHAAAVLQTALDQLSSVDRAAALTGSEEPTAPANDD
jgi:hypothetical protein